MPYRLPNDRTVIMGVLNVTPDSFSDGGKFADPDAAYAHGMRLAEDGADIVDVGGESTRPSASPVTAEEELARIRPVVTRLASAGLTVSIDTYKADVAKAALDLGATIVNDVGGLRDERMLAVCAEAGCPVITMHMNGDPQTMQDEPAYKHVVDEVLQELTERARRLEGAGVAHHDIWIDPGIGFGKTIEHNLLLLKNLDWFTKTGYPVVVGVSRKAFIGRLTGDAPADDRLEGTLAAQVVAAVHGARVVRCHDVKAARRSLAVTEAILAATNGRPDFPNGLDRTLLPSP